MSRELFISLSAAISWRTSTVYICVCVCKCMWLFVCLCVQWSSCGHMPRCRSDGTRIVMDCTKCLLNTNLWSFRKTLNSNCIGLHIFCCYKCFVKTSNRGSWWSKVWRLLSNVFLFDLRRVSNEKIMSVICQLQLLYIQLPGRSGWLVLNSLESMKIILCISEA